MSLSKPRDWKFIRGPNSLLEQGLLAISEIRLEPEHCQRQSVDGRRRFRQLISQYCGHSLGCIESVLQTVLYESSKRFVGPPEYETVNAAAGVSSTHARLDTVIRQEGVS